MLKKVFLSGILGLALFFGITLNVRADEITLDDVIDSMDIYNKSEDDYDSLYAIALALLDVTDYEITQVTDGIQVITNLSDGSSYTTILNYDSATDLLSYEYSSTNSDMQNAFDSFWVDIALTEILELNGFSGSIISVISSDIASFTLDDNGLEVTSITIDEDTEIYEIAKIYLNDLNFDSLYSDLVPVLSLSNITDSSIDITVSVSGSESDINYYIYRSTDSVNYELAIILATDGSLTTVTDDELKQNTTYYYKAIVELGKSYSEVSSATTSITVLEDVTTNSDTIPDNPSTGIFIPIIALVIAMFIAGIIVKYTNKNDKFIKF